MLLNCCSLATGEDSPMTFNPAEGSYKGTEKIPHCQKLRTCVRFMTCGNLHKYIKTTCLNMAALNDSQKRRSSLAIDYKQLNEFSSATLYDSIPRKKRSRLYEVERIITRRVTRQVKLVIFVYINLYSVSMAMAVCYCQ